MKTNTLNFVSFLLAISVLFASCASTTLIQSYPSGAKVYIDNQSVGTTPYWYSDTKIMGSVTNVDMVKEGYEPYYTSLSRTEEVNIGAIIGGFVCWVPFLWTMQYKPSHNYELVPLKPQPQNPIPQTELQAETQKKTEIQTPPTPQPEPKVVSAKLQRLRELKQMLDEKIITAQDFEKQKQKILDEK
jgi:hypothetical protein